MNPDKDFYSDANSTMRMNYGVVGDYYPRDAVLYTHYTTLEGVMEKEDPNNFEFVVSERLKEFYKSKDYGPYGVDGTLNVCFTSNNDITGGNSGSPVLNGNGELLGLAFDGNWEAMSGDVAFETELQKCINVDIRYVLFVIDKYAGAKHLVDEMTLVSSPAEEAAPVAEAATVE
jgi:peptidase S46-like protein